MIRCFLPASVVNNKKKLRYVSIILNSGKRLISWRPSKNLKMKRIIFFILVILGAVNSWGQNGKVTDGSGSKLAVIWTSSDPEVAEKVCFMYTQNAKKQGWFNEVVLIVWGPSVKLLAENDDLKADIVKIMEMGITVEASLSCAQLYGVGPDLNDLDIDVKQIGVPVTGYIKEGWHIVSF